MPGETVGVYTGQLDAGTQVSSTYEGRHLTVREDELIHPFILDTFVNKGDPVVLCDAGVPATYGHAVGVAFNDGAALADLIAIDTEGIWNLKVDAYDDLGGSAIEIGDLLYIRAGGLTGTTSIVGTGDAELSKISNGATQIPFGYALGSMVATGTGRIAVKVHFDPSQDNAKRTWYTAPTGAYTYGKHYTTVFTGGESTGLEYHDQRVTGAQTGHIYGWGTWMELALAFVPDGSLIVGHEIGIYDVGCDLAGNNGRVVMQQMQAQLASVPGTSFHWWRMNLDAAGGTATALMAAANPTSVGLVLGAGVAGAKLGGLPLVDQGGVVYFVRLYATAV